MSSCQSYEGLVYLYKHRVSSNTCCSQWPVCTASNVIQTLNSKQVRLCVLPKPFTPLLYALCTRYAAKCACNLTNDFGAMFCLAHQGKAAMRTSCKSC